MFIDCFKIKNNANQTLILHDEPKNGKVLLEVKRLDHAGFEDDSDFYLNQCDLANLKTLIDQLIIIIG